MTIESLRRAYADEVAAVAQVSSSALIEAFARVPRERFLGPGPWSIAQLQDPAAPYRVTPDDRVEHIYHNVVVAIDAARQLNNGQPSSLALWLDAAGARPGDSVFHLGCGVGYYTAILAEIVGPSGRVVACEIDPDLAGRAREHLADWPQVEVVEGDGSAPRGPHDVIFVNAGATHARPEWISALAPGGRLVLPLTIHVPGFAHGFGAMLRFERDDRLWPARIVSPVGIYDCAGARDEDAEAELRTVLARKTAPRLTGLSLEPHERAAACLYHRPGFCLQAEEPAGPT